jgi:uncharacterized protein (TIGR03435 family)
MRAPSNGTDSVKSSSKRTTQYRLIVTILASSVAAITAFGWQQTAAAPSFSVASVKFTGTSGASGMRAEVGMLQWPNATLQRMIQAAHQVQAYQVSGGPAWLTEDRYSIYAKADAPANRSQLMAMLCTLLAERFKLLLHREIREIPAYAVVVGKNGPKFRTAKEGATASAIPTPGTIHFKDVAGLAGFLSQRSDRPVMDETKLAGVFDITLDIRGCERAASADAAQNGPPASASGNPTAARLFDDCVTAAAQEQSGLRLEARKERVEMLVIDRAVKASEN